MEVRYSEKDQAIINAQDEQLRHFEDVFLHTMKTCGMGPTDAKRALLESPERALLLNVMTESRARMVPTFVFKKDV